MKDRFAWLKQLYSPTAVGLYVTAAFVWTASTYFANQGGNNEKQGALEQFLNLAHQKSVDFRLKQRGERHGSSQVGLLTVDEKAVATVGRWPWPREVTAKAMENAVKYGAKVLSFDMVFSEPSSNQLAETLQKIQSQFKLPEATNAQIAEEIKSRDGDAAMGKMFGQYSKNLVLGSFGPQSEQVPDNETFDYCFDLIFSLQPESDLWLNKEQSGIIVQNGPPELPQTLKDFYRNHLQQIAATLTESAKAKNAGEEYALQSEILQKQVNYCTTFLDKENDETYSTIDENWPAILSAEDDAFRQKYPTFESWTNFIKSVSSRSAVPLVSKWTMNIPKMMASGESFNTGYFIAKQDEDGTIRRSNIILRSGHTYMPSIGLKAFLLANSYNTQVSFKYNGVTRLQEIEKLEVLNEDGEFVMKIPVDNAGRLAINYAGKQMMFPYISLAEMLTDSDELTYSLREPKKGGGWEVQDHKVKKAEFLKDKIFVVGATAIGIYDLRVTPFEENFPGAETHVTVIDNLLRQDFLVNAPWEEMAMLVGLSLLGVILSFALSHLGALPGLTLVVVLFAGISLGDRFFLFGKGTVITIILPLTLILALFIVLISYKYFTEERHKKELRSTFAKYVSPAIVEEILSDPSKIELGGRKAKVTVFFSDVRGFTTISEKLDPRALSDLLNEYLTPMTDLVFATRGTLDKYMGDAIMAFFGAPIPHPDHAKDACRCALQHLKKLFELQAEFKAKNLPIIDLGIGLNTGEVSVGNMGSQTVRSYTVMGDAVNLASRLEGINKQYGTRIIISEFTHKEVQDSFVCRELDWVRVKGKLQPVKIYELLGEGKVDSQTQDMLKWFNQGYIEYHQMKWTEAIYSFKQALAVRSEDPVSALYVERCNEFIAEPPPANWDGVFEMKTK